MPLKRGEVGKGVGGDNMGGGGRKGKGRKGGTGWHDVSGLRKRGRDAARFHAVKRTTWGKSGMGWCEVGGVVVHRGRRGNWPLSPFGYHHWGKSRRYRGVESGNQGYHSMGPSGWSGENEKGKGRCDGNIQEEKQKMHVRGEIRWKFIGLVHDNGVLGGVWLMFKQGTHPGVGRLHSEGNGKWGHW